MAVIGDIPSSLFSGLSGFWQRFFRDTADLQAFYQASEVYLGQAYLDLLSSVLNIGLVDTPIFNREVWKLFTIREDEVSFVAGASSIDDRFVYDMPGDIACIDFLQNTIFNPGVLLERDVDFEVLNNDGFLRFLQNPFREYNSLPIPGVAWRTIELESGNRFTDSKRSTDWYTDTSVQIGDTLRFLGYAGVYLTTTFVSDGSYQYVGSSISFTSTAAFASFDDSYIGNFIEVTFSVDDTYNGLYRIQSVTATNAVVLEPTQHAPLLTSASLLTWSIRKFTPFVPSKDYRVNYIDDIYLVGDRDNPYPLTFTNPLEYAVVRSKPDLVAHGDILNVSASIASSSNGGSFYSSVVIGYDGYLEVSLTGDIPFDSSMCVDDSVLAPSDYYWFSASGVYNGPYLLKHFIDSHTVILDVKASDLGITGSESFSNWVLAQTAPITTFMNVKHIVSGSFTAHAYRYYGSTLVEGIDYEVDYINGVFIPKRSINDVQVHTCSYTWLEEVMLATSGTIEEFTEGRVKQISFWVPQVLVDRFTLYYSYGSLLNRFGVSSETYKSFLRGIMQLYMTGPTLKMIESALNVVVGLPVVKYEGEVLQSYDSGVTASGTDGCFIAATAPLYIPMFSTVSRTFTELDVGTSIVISNALNEINEGRFKIANIIDANTVEVVADFGVVNESSLEWVTNINYTKIVITDQNTYEFPYNIPIDPLIMDLNNVGRLTFKAFDTMTEAFRVVDYLEDPQWYYGKEIPSILWPNTARPRRLAATTLYENIIGPIDDALIGDPGLFIGADDDGNVIQIPDVASLRRCAAFILFDRYLKFHMFYVQISPALELTNEAISDINDLVLIAKPSYTYPYVEPETVHQDLLKLFEEFAFHYKFVFGSEEALDLATNELIIGGDGRYSKIGDYHTYVEFIPAISTGFTAPGGSVPTFFDITFSSNVRPLSLILDATINSGIPVRENVNYTVDYDPDSLTFGRITPIGTDNWDAGLVSYTGLGLAVLNLLDDPAPDTRLRWTPMAIGGTDPGYIRKHITDIPTACEHIDRALVMYINDGGSSYTYP